MKLPNWMILLILKLTGGDERMEKIKMFLMGKKTYIASIGLVITAVLEYLGDNDLGKLINKIIEAFALSSVRSAIANK